MVFVWGAVEEVCKWQLRVIVADAPNGELTSNK